jgi:hypothetical protein
MEGSSALTLVAVVLLFHSDYALGQANTAKVFLLEDAVSNQWCAYKNEATWNAAVEHARAMRVAALAYSNGRLSKIDVTETDESGDWIAYDRYFVDDRGQMIKLSRMINVLPGDRSVLQTFLISDGKVKKIATTEKQLSTGKPLTAPESVWVPNLPVETTTGKFAFSGLLGRRPLWTNSKYCVQISGAQR